MRVVSRFALAIALVTFSAGSLHAQFTAVIAPPKTAPSAKAVVQQQQVAARQDSLARVTLSNMKAWVDSAAGSVGTVAPMTKADSTAVAAMPADSAAAKTPHTHAAAAVVSKGDVVTDSTFRNGGRAPNTASPLPLLALLGMTSLVAGLALLRRGRA